MALKYTVRLQKLQSIRLNEGGDEIYFKVNGNINYQGLRVGRPEGSPDYWRFDKAKYTPLDKLVLQGADGTFTNFNLKEQDGGFRGRDDNLGDINIGVQNNSPIFQPGFGTSYRGQDSQNLHVVDFYGSDSHYRGYFEVSVQL